MERLAQELAATGQQVVLRPTLVWWTAEQLLALPIHPSFLGPQAKGFGAAVEIQEGSAIVTDGNHDDWYVMRDEDGKLWRQGPA